MGILTHIFKDRGADDRTERIYLDHAAATPIRASVLEKMKPYWREVYGNPGAIHAEGRHAANAVAEARGSVARELAVRPDEVTFTSGGTEANNLALFGVVGAARAAGRAPGDIEIISTEIEHPSIIESLKVLEQEGVRIIYVPTDQYGLIDQKKLTELITEHTLLISFSYVNSEVGTIEDVKHITHAVRKYKKHHPAQELFVHLDAAQAPLWLPCRVDSLGVDSLSLDSGKFCGPKGAGVLVHKRSVPIARMVYGGGQESGLRSGTENVPLVVGFAAALAEAQDSYEKRAERVSLLRDRFIRSLEKEITDVSINGSTERRVANNINISIRGVDGEYAVVALDEAGVAASTRSACGSLKGGGSSVVRQLSGEHDRAFQTIRFTLGEETTEAQLDSVVQALAAHVALVRTDGEDLTQ